MRNRVRKRITAVFYSAALCLLLLALIPIWAVHAFVSRVRSMGKVGSTQRISRVSVDDVDLNAVMRSGRPVIIEGLVDRLNLRTTPDADGLRILAATETGAFTVRSHKRHSPYFLYTGDYGAEFDHAADMTLDEFLDFMFVTESDPDTCTYRLFSVSDVNGGIGNIIDDISDGLGEMVDRPSDRQASGIWVGSEGVVTPLHHDAWTGLLFQMEGSKRVVMFSPDDRPNLYFTSPFAAVDRWSMLPARSREATAADYPRFEKATRHEAVLQPGDVLFIPPFWSHEIEALEPNISIPFRFADAPGRPSESGIPAACFRDLPSQVPRASCGERVTDAGAQLIEAVYEHRLTERAQELLESAETPDAARQLARRAIEVCEQIGDEVAHEQERILTLLRDDGIQVEPERESAAQQNHTIRLRVANFETADRAAERLGKHGFTRWEQWTGGAAVSFSRMADQLAVGRTSDNTTIVRLRWADRRHRTRIDRIVKPTAGDWDMVSLPRWAWRAYSVVRAIRLVAERLGLRPRHEAGLGPFLSTPETLLDPLFSTAGIGPDDVVVDLGCGDGRVVVAAATRLGCRARGVENSIGLVDAARERVRAGGVTDLVEIDDADARSADLTGVTVVFMFLPTDVLADLLPDLLRRMQPGGRVVAHEQNRLPPSIAPMPDESLLLVTDGAVTVAHCWTAG